MSPESPLATARSGCRSPSKSLTAREPGRSPRGRAPAVRSSPLPLPSSTETSSEDPFGDDQVRGAVAVDVDDRHVGGPGAGGTLGAANETALAVAGATVGGGEDRDGEQEAAQAVGTRRCKG